ALCALILWWEISSQRFWAEKGVPYIRGLPFIGIFGKSILLLKNFSVIFSELHHHKRQKDEPISGFYFLKTPCLIVRDIELIKRILVKDFHSFPNRLLEVNPKNDGIAANFLPISRGVAWREFRKVFTRSLTPAHINTFYPLGQEIVKNLEAKLLDGTQLTGSNVYNVLELALQFTCDMTFLFGFGIHTECLKGKDKVHIEMSRMPVGFNFWRYCSFFMYFLFPRLANFFRITLTPKLSKEYLQNVFDYLSKIREEKEFQRDDLTNTVLEMMKDNKEVFTTDAALVQFGTLQVGGTVGTSSIISFALYELSQNPNIQDKLRMSFNELTVEKETTEYRDIANLKYFDMIYKETLRLYSGVMFIDREFSGVNDSDGYSLEPHHTFKIPRGIPIFISIYGINRDPKYYKNPHNFDPEHFESSKENPGMNFFINFGQGPRQCPGQTLSEFQFKMSLFHILRKFRVKKCKKTPKRIVLD
uniref:Cytochrome n=1 Tax=Lutzomyia longipalpis TaxID=7200 RepID=A0A1B0CVT3_LUTLO